MSVLKNKYSKLLNKDIYFYIPYYQRYYDWDEYQCLEILTDLKELIEEKYVNKKNHFMGMFVYRKAATESDEYYELIDGQQRLTTIFLILKSINLYSSFLTKKMNNIINDSSLFNLNNLNANRIKLRLNNEENDKDSFESWINHEIEINTDEWNKINWDFFISYFKKAKKIKSKKSQMFKNVLNILEWLHKNINDIDSLINFNNTLLSCEIIEFDISNSEDNPQNIFESLNSKSKPLSDVDLIKNYIFMNIPYGNDQKALYDERWIVMEKSITKKRMLDFFKFFLMIKEEKYIEEKNHSIFKHFKRSIIIDTKSQAEKILDEIKDWYYVYLCSSNFCDFKKFEEIISKNEDYQYLIKYKKVIDSQFISEKVGYTSLIIMGLIMYIEENLDNKFNLSDFKRVLSLIDKYVIRWKINSNQGNLSEPFIKLYKSIKKSKKTNLCKNVKDTIFNFNGQFKFFTDIEFETKLTNNSLKDNERYMLNYMSEKYYQKKYKIEIYKSLFNEEHLSPKTPLDPSKVGRNYDRDVNYIGNVLFVAEKLNNELSNFEWPKKWSLIKSEIKNPRFVMTNSLKAFYDSTKNEKIIDWNFEYIEKRTLFLTKNIFIPETAMKDKRKDDNNSTSI